MTMKNSLPLISKDQCTRCGACSAVSDEVQYDADGFPVTRDDLPEKERERLLSVCTGKNWNYKELLSGVHGEEVSKSYDPSSPDFGTYSKLYICQSTSNESRSTGQSGGVSTSLIRAGLEFGVFETFLGVRRPAENLNRPFEAEPFIIKDTKDVDAAAGSKYAICHSLDLLRDLLKSGKTFGASFLPCQTAGFYQLAKEELAELKDSCRLIIGPFCGLNMESTVGSEIAKALRIDPADVVGFDNRAGEFPGATKLKMRNGDSVFVDRTAHRALYRMFSPNRCFSCTDFGNELADITIADCWIRSKGRNDFEYPDGAAYIVARTKRGEQFVEMAIAEGFLEVRRIPSADELQKTWMESFIYRKVRAYNRIHQHKKIGWKTPSFDFPLPSYTKKFSKADNTELFVRRIFSNSFVRKWFLRWWMKAHLLDENGLARNESRVAKMMGRKVFTHRSNASSVMGVFSSICMNYLIEITPGSKSIKRWVRRKKKASHVDR